MTPPAFVVHRSSLPVLVSPYWPRWEQNAPGCTPSAVGDGLGDSFGLGLFVVGGDVGAAARSTLASVRVRTRRYGQLRPDRYPRTSPALVAQGIEQRFPKPWTVVAVPADDLDIFGNRCCTGDVDGIHVRSADGKMPAKITDRRRLTAYELTSSTEPMPVRQGVAVNCQTARLPSRLQRPRHRTQRTLI